MKTCPKCTFENTGARRRRCEVCGSRLDPPEQVCDGTGKRQRSSSSSQLSVSAGHSADLTPAGEPQPTIIPAAVSDVAAKPLAPLAAELKGSTTAPSMDSLFTTARGGVIRVSRQALAAAQEKFKLQFDLDVATAEPLKPPADQLQLNGAECLVSEQRSSAARRSAAPHEDPAPEDSSPAVGTGDLVEVPPAPASAVSALHTPARQVNLPPPVVSSMSSVKQPGSALSSRGSLGGFRTPRSLLGEPVARLPFRPPVATAAVSAGDGEGSRQGFQAPRGTGASTFATLPTPRDSTPAAVLAESPVTVGITGAMKPLDCDLLKQCEVRLPLRKDVPSPASVVMGDFDFSSSCVCPTLSSAMNLDSGTAASHVKVTPRHFSAALRSMGAAASGVKEDWVRHMLRVVLWKLACHDAQCGQDVDGERILSPVHALAQLAYRYNREYIDGHRSVLRRIAEKDSSPTVLMVLCVSRVMPERAGPHQLIVEVTDGWYFARAQLDLPLSQLVRDGILNCGQKIVVWGASSPVEHGTSVLELEGTSSSLLALSLNAVKPAAPSAALGALPSYCVLRTPLSAIHANGGVVPCIAGVVTRSLPSYYVEKVFLENGSATGDRSSAGMPNSRIVRNHLAEAKHCEEWEAKKYAAYERAIADSNGGADEVTAMMRDKFSRHVTCCKTIVLEADGVAVAVQVNLSGGMDSDDSLPAEGDHVRLFSLYPAKASSMLPALNLQLLYSRGALQYAVDKTQQPPAGAGAGSNKCGARIEQGTSSFKFSRKVLTSFDQLAGCKQGQLVDFLAVAIGICDADHDCLKKGFNCVWVGCTTRVNVFVVVEVHSAVGARELMIPTLSPGVPCYIQNATFASLDESSEYTCVRLFATEFTAFVTKSIVSAVQKQIDALSAATSRWKDTLELGLQLVHDPEQHAGCFLPQWKRQEAGLVATTPFVSTGNVAGQSAPASGPYYLTRSQQTPIGRIGVQLHTTATTGRDAVSAAKSLARPLFGKSPDKPATAAAREDSNSENRINRGCAASASELCVRWPVHLFGNFDCSSSKATLVVVTATSGTDRRTLTVDAHSGVVAGAPRSVGNDDKATNGYRDPGSYATSAEPKPVHDVFLQVAFRTHLSTAVDVLVGLEHLGSLGASTACQPQQLSALCAEEDQYALAAARSQTLASGGDTAAKHWRMLFLHSVVVHDELVALANHTHHKTDDDDSLEPATADLDWQTQCASLQRWNAAIVPNANDVLWWSHHEWTRLWEHLQSTFEGKLFKLTLTKENRVTRLFLLKEACNIDDLMSS